MNKLELTIPRIILYSSLGFAIATGIFQLALMNKFIILSSDVEAPYLEGYSYDYQSISRVAKIKYPMSGDCWVWTEQQGDTIFIRRVKVDE